MRCPKCGMEDREIRDYCIHCGERIELSSVEAETVFAADKRRDREERVAKRLRSWLVFAVAVLIAIIAFRSIFRGVPHEPVEAYFPPPTVDLAVAERLPIKLMKPPSPIMKLHAIRSVGEREDETLKRLFNNVMRSAPTWGPPAYAFPGGSVKGFEVSRYGESITVFTVDGRKSGLIKTDNGKANPPKPE